MKKIVIYILLLLFIAVNANAQSFRYGFARGTVSKRPNQWKGLVFSQKYSLGCTGINKTFDVSGYGNHGTTNGSMTIDDWVVSGNPKLPGYALDFDGSDDYLAISDLGQNSHDNMTFCFWVNFRDWKGDSSSRSILLQAGSGSQITVWGSGTTIFYYDGSTWAWLDITDLSLNTWYNLVFVYKWDGNSVVLSAYIDGVINVADYDTGDGRLQSGEIRLGGTFGSRYHNGYFSEVRIYDRALSVGEIWDMYQYPDAMLEFKDVFLAKPPAAAPGGGINQAIIISRVFEKYFRGFTFLYEG